MRWETPFSMMRKEAPLSGTDASENSFPSRQPCLIFGRHDWDMPLPLSPHRHNMSLINCQFIWHFRRLLLFPVAPCLVCKMTFHYSTSIPDQFAPCHREALSQQVCVESSTAVWIVKKIIMGSFVEILLETFFGQLQIIGLTFRTYGAV